MREMLATTAAIAADTDTTQEIAQQKEKAKARVGTKERARASTKEMGTDGGPREKEKVSENNRLDPA